MRYGLTCLALLAAVRVSSGAVTVDFEDWAGGDENLASVDSRGYNLAADAGHFFYIFGPADKRLTTRLDAVVTMTKSGGGLFSIESVDLGEGNHPAGSTSIMLTGFLSGGGSISQTFLLDGNYATMQGFAVTGFVGLTSAVFQPLNGQSLSIDNIVVPEPGAAALFFLAALLLSHRKV